MKSLSSHFMLFFAAGLLISSASISAAPTPGNGWGQIDRDIQIGQMWDRVTNRHYGGVNNALQWPGGWWNPNLCCPVERRTMANFKGFVIGARNVPDPQYPNVVWPYMVGQRDGSNDGETGEAIRGTPPNPLATNVQPADATQILFKGRLIRRTFRQANAVVTVNGVVNSFLTHAHVASQTPELVGDESDAPYQDDVIDPTIPADLMVETYSWSRMGIATNRMIYAFVDRRNDDFHFWHWRMINDGRWGRLGIDKVDCCGGTWGTVHGVMISLMFQWDRSSAGAARTGGWGATDNDTIWRYYGADYDGARTEDMRLVYVIDGDQSPLKFPGAYANGSQDDIGDPDPTTGELLSAKTGGWQVLHYDVSASDRHDDPAQPLTLGWTNLNRVLRTNTEGHEPKYNQMRWGFQKDGGYYAGAHQTTALRGSHPYGGSWMKASNDPATSGTYWPGKVLGVDIDVTDVEQQAGFGPDDLAPGDTINSVHVLGVKGLDIPYAQEVGRRWLRGEIPDAAKDSLVWSTIDSLFATMRQAKSVYESATFGDRYASTRAEFEEALRQAVAQGKLALSPPAPATFAVVTGFSDYKFDLSWTLNTSTGSSIAGWRIYRALANFKGDSAWALVHTAAPNERSWSDSGVVFGRTYYYYLTTFDAEGNESTMFTRTDEPAILPGDPEAITAGNLLRFSLSQNAPNPFNPSTVIRLSLASAGPVRLDVYNANGQIVKTLVDRPLAAGSHEIVWDGTDARDRPVASGTYFYRLFAGGETSIRKMTLIR